MRVRDLQNVISNDSRLSSIEDAALAVAKAGVSIFRVSNLQIM